MRPIAFLGLLLLLAGCVPPVGDNMRRVAVAPLPADIAAPQAGPVQTSTTPPAVGWGGTLPSVPSGGLGAEAPIPAPQATRMPSIGPQAGTSIGTANAPAGTGQSITVPNGNGTSTIIHPDGTMETVPTPK